MTVYLLLLIIEFTRGTTLHLYMLNMKIEFS